MMKSCRTTVLAGLLAAAPYQTAFADHHEGPSVGPSPVPVLNAQGEAIGTATFEQTPHGVLVAIDAQGLPPGEHGFHIHETGACDPAEGFSSAGGHFNPRSREHGLKVNAGHHAGDMPNQFVDADGTLRTVVLNSAVTMETGLDSLADADGSALIVHAGLDDYLTQPTGAAGGRLACAVIRPPQPM